MDSWERANEEVIPPMKEFYNNLTQNISQNKNTIMQ